MLILVGEHDKGTGVPFSPQTISGKRLRSMVSEIGLHCEFDNVFLYQDGKILQRDLVSVLGSNGIVALGRIAQIECARSLNGSTPVKQATMGEYWAPGKKKYEAIRVPLALSGKLCHPEKPENETSDSETNHVKLEQTCLSLLRAYDRDEVSIDQVLKTVLRYNRLKGDTTDRRAKYEQTLQDRPWRSCPCKICRDIGIEVIIFRGNDRNRRRGFHNTWVFYRQLQTALAADS